MAAAAHPHHPAAAGEQLLGLMPTTTAFFRRPSDAELINHYLVAKISAGQQQQHEIPAAAIVVNEANVYSKPPCQLVTEYAPVPGTAEWLFFSRLQYMGSNQRRCSRTVHGGGDRVLGRWRPETVRAVDGTVGGYVKKLCYQRRKEHGGWGKSSGWLMLEYGFDNGSDIVLCKVYRSAQQERQGTSSSMTTLLLQQTESFLMANDDDDGGVQIPLGEDMDAFFRSYLLGGAGDELGND